MHRAKEIGDLTSLRSCARTLVDICEKNAYFKDTLIYFKNKNRPKTVISIAKILNK